MDRPVDPASAPGAPLYREVERRIVVELKEGRWRPGTAIPSERSLAQRFGVSIGTVRKALDELAADRLLVRRQGRGTFVATHDRDRLLFHFFHLVREDGHREYPVVELLRFARSRADAREARALGVVEGAPVFRIRNRLSLESRPVLIDDIVIPCALFPALTAKRFRERPDTIYNLYQDAFGVSVVRTTERLGAVTADAEVAALLGLPGGAPLLRIRRVALTYAEVPVELRTSLVNTARHEYASELRRGASTEARAAR
jgi:GntR family transcriptional regulator